MTTTPAALHDPAPALEPEPTPAPAAVPVAEPAPAAEPAAAAEPAPAAALVLLGRDAILAANDIPVEDVEVPEWGGTVRVRGLSGTDRDAFEAASIQGKGKNVQVNLRNLRARLVQKSVVDEHGQLVFRPVDVEALGRKSAAALNRVYEVAQRLSGLTDADVEELTEDFDDAQNGSSTSD